MYSITFVIFPVTKTIFSTRGCFSATLGLKMNIDTLLWPYGHSRLSNLSFPALVTPENNHSYQKLFPSLGKWQMNEVKYYYSITTRHYFYSQNTNLILYPFLGYLTTHITCGINGRQRLHGGVARLLRTRRRPHHWKTHPSCGRPKKTK